VTERQTMRSVASVINNDHNYLTFLLFWRILISVFTVQLTT